MMSHHDDSLLLYVCVTACSYPAVSRIRRKHLEWAFSAYGCYAAASLSSAPRCRRGWSGCRGSRPSGMPSTRVSSNSTGTGSVLGASDRLAVQLAKTLFPPFVPLWAAMCRDIPAFISFLHL